LQTALVDGNTRNNSGLIHSNFEACAGPVYCMWTFATSVQNKTMSRGNWRACKTWVKILTRYAEYITRIVSIQKRLIYSRLNNTTRPHRDSFRDIFKWFVILHTSLNFRRGVLIFAGVF
jgi:Fe-S-cluster-containing dehydrogenase component